MGDMLDWLCRLVGACVLVLVSLGSVVVLADWVLTRTVKSLRVWFVVLDWFIHRRAFRRYMQGKETTTTDRETP